MEKFSKKIGAFGISASVVIAALGLVYRSTLYWKIPVAPSESYGFGDLIDFSISLILLFVVGFTSFISVLLIILWDGRNQKAGLTMLAFSAGSYLAYYFLHPLVPRLM